MHLAVQSPTHHLFYLSSLSSLKHTCNLPFHLPLLAPLPSSLCAAGSPPPSINLFFFPSLSSLLLLFLSIFHTISKCSSLVAQTFFRCTASPLLAAVCHSHCLSAVICSHLIPHLCLSFTSLLSIFLPPRALFPLHLSLQ